MGELYDNYTEITGELQSNTRVRYKYCMNLREETTLLVFLFLTLISSGALIWFMFNSVASVKLNAALAVALFLILSVEIIRLIQSITLIVFAYHAKDPVPMVPQKNLRVAVLTTIVPGKEPFDLVSATLLRMKDIDAGPGNVMDVWLLDEGNDPDIKAWCELNGVHHFSRKGIPEWNTASGAHKAKTKHGNHNSWRAMNENKYDIVAQMDPDHIPHYNFLMRTLGYFADPDIAFVVAPQVYGNINDNWIAKGSAFQAYIFHGIIQRGGNGMKAPLLIGTNHLYRVSAFQQINGYQDSIIEDHLTSMVIYGAKNYITGNKWRGVYTPDILAVGEGPTSFTDYFNQQKRWAYGIWEIASKSTAGAVKKMNKLQALSFLMLQSFYPSVAVAWVASIIATVFFSILDVQYRGLSSTLFVLWAFSISSSLSLFFWLRRFNLVEHERKDWGFVGISLLLMCVPVYVSAAWQAIRRKPLTYAVTAKGDLASPDTVRTFSPHISWILFSTFALGIASAASNDSFTSSIFWTLEHMAICLLPLGIHLLSVYVPKRTRQPFNYEQFQIQIDNGMQLATEDIEN